MYELVGIRRSAYVQQHPLDKTLTRFQCGKQPKQHEIPMRQEDYYQLLDWTGRVIRDDKKDRIPNHLADI